MNRSTRSSGLRRFLFVVGCGAAGVMGIGQVQAQNLCGGVDYPFPYTDVSAVGAAFCPGIMEAYVTGVSKGTTPTTFSPNETVTRVQMTTFLQRSLDQGLARVSRRAALNQWWTPQLVSSFSGILQYDTFGTPLFCASDGESVYSTRTNNAVYQIQASTGNKLSEWTGVPNALAILVLPTFVVVAGDTSPNGTLYLRSTGGVFAGTVTSVDGLGYATSGIAFDGTSIWTANFGPPGSVSIVNSALSVTTVTTGFIAPMGILFDGSHIWVTDYFAGKLLMLNSSGNILQTVIVGASPEYPVFDGANIWVPNSGSNSITVVQASTGNVVATISADANNQLSGPETATFDGERILVTNQSGDSVTLFKAADLSFIANMPTGPGTHPYGACSDGATFFVSLRNSLNMLKF